MRITFLIAAPLAALLSAMPSAKAEPDVKATCRTSHVAVMAASSRQMTSSKFYVDVADSSVRIIQGGGQPGCIVVTFSAEAAAPPEQLLMVRALLDDAETCEPGSVYFARGDANVLATSVRTMTFICPDVAPGSHRIKMQYLSDQGGSVALEYRTLTVHYYR